VVLPAAPGPTTITRFTNACDAYPPGSLLSVPGQMRDGEPGRFCRGRRACRRVCGLRSRAFEEPQVERREYQDDSDVYYQARPEVVPEEQDIHTDHDRYQREHVKHDGCVSPHGFVLLCAPERSKNDAEHALLSRISDWRLAAALRRAASCCSVSSSSSRRSRRSGVMVERVTGRHLDWDDPSWLVCACSCCRVIASMGNPGCCWRPTGQIWMARGRSAASRCGMSQQANCGGEPVPGWPLWFPGAWFPLTVRSIAGRLTLCRTRSTG